MPQEQNIAAGAYFSGDSLVLTFTVLKPDATPKDLTGATVVWGLANAQGKGLRLSKNASITDAVNGVCTVTLSPADTASLSGTFYHELEVTDAAANVSTVTYGSFVIEKDSVT